MNPQRLVLPTGEPAPQERPEREPVPGPFYCLMCPGNPSLLQDALNQLVIDGYDVDIQGIRGPVTIDMVIDGRPCSQVVYCVIARKRFPDAEPE